MIVVDTSVWIAAERGRNPAILSDLRELIAADEVALALPVRAELRAGVGARDRKRFLRGLSGLPVARPTDETWTTIEQWIDRAAEHGQTFNQTDMLIAALADELGALVWTLDKDFQRLERLQLVRLYR
jgi:predicted nucleic acid-binding protein